MLTRPFCLIELLTALEHKVPIVGLCLVGVGVRWSADRRMAWILIDGQVHTCTRPLLCVFDSGLTGIVLSQSLVDELPPDLARRVPAQAPYSLAAAAEAGARGTTARSLRLTVVTERGKRVRLGSSRRASPLFYTQAVALNWFVDKVGGPHVVALGQCVLGKGRLTVDAPQQRAAWDADAA